MYQVKILKIRDGEGKNTKMELHIDYKKMRISETGLIYKEDSNEPIALADAVRDYKNISAKSIPPNTKFDKKDRDDDDETKDTELW
jgi:hypothetical protein